VVAVNASLGEAAFEAARAEGRAMSQEQAIAEALRVADGLSSIEAQAGTPAPASPA
jgi:hypothetical protein